MKVSSVKIKNVLGVDDFQMDCGQITVLSGPNGSGKTSRLEALKNAIGGGNLAKLKSINADDSEPAEIVLTLESDEHGKIIVHKKDKKLSVKTQIGDTAAFKDEKPPQDFLSGLFDAKLSNPLEFLNVRDKDRVQLLLESLDLNYSQDELFEAMEMEPDNWNLAPEDLHPLVAIEFIRSQIFSARTGTNREMKEKLATCEQTRRSIPAEIPKVEDIEEKESQLSQKRQMVYLAEGEIERTEQLTKQKAESDKNEFASKQREAFAIYEHEIRAKVEEEIRLEKESMIARCTEFDQSENLKMKRAEELAYQGRGELKQQNEEIEKLATELAELREQERNAIRVRTLHEQADGFELMAINLKADSERMTRALQALDDYKSRMVEDLPIQGLEVSGNEVKVNGIKWDQLNTAQRIRIAVKVACLRFQDSPFKPVWIDGAEALDQENFDVLCEELKDAGAQAFIGKVADGDFLAESR